MKLYMMMISKSIKQHYISSILTIFCVALSTALLFSTISLRQQTHENFTQTGIGIDAVLGPKGSPLQIVLNAVYHLEEMPGKIKWDYYKKVAADPLVISAVPFCTGHSYAGFRVNAIDADFFENFEYAPCRKFSFSESGGGRGRAFSTHGEAVIGSSVALELQMNIGSEFSPVCGVNQGDPTHDDRIKVVGILAATATPYDKAIYIPLKTFYSLSGHSNDVAAMTIDESHREISGAYLKLKKIRENTLHPGITGLKYNINQSPNAQLVIPNETLPKLFNIIGWVDSVLLMISITVGIMSMLFLFSTLFNSTQEKKRDIALIRFLGAPRKLVFMTVIGESLTLAISGLALGLALSRLIVSIAADQINIETGIRLSASYISPGEIRLIPAILLIGAIAGLIPAINAYKTNIIKHLKPLS